MRRFVSLLILLSFIHPAYCQNAIELDKVKEFDVEYDKQPQALKGSLFVDDLMTAQDNINKQQRDDLEDIEKLWTATVDNNPMISFCIRKLTIPAEQRRIHSSLMAKTMSTIISGAAMLPSFLGMNYGIQSGSYAAGRLVTGLLNKENNEKLQNPAITDTEAIELASLVEDLQDEIIVDYFKYKGASLKLKKCREQLLLYNKNYSDALNKNDFLDITVSSSQWEDELIEEYRLKQEVKKYQMALIRLAGKKTVDGLNISNYDLTVQNIDKNDLNYEKKMLDVSIKQDENKKEKKEGENKNEKNN